MCAHGLLAGQTLVIGGVSLNYTASLRPGAPFTLVLIHGFGAALQTWDDIYPQLCANYSVIRMDLKGSGFSGKPKDGHYALAEQVNLVVSLLRELGQQKIILAGHSLGGGLALLTYFETVAAQSGLNVCGLILIASAGYPQRLPLFIQAARNPLAWVLARLTTPRFRVRLVLNHIYSVKKIITPERIEKYAYFLGLPGSQYALAQTVKSMAAQNHGDLAATFSSINVPTLIIWGENDPVIPVAHARHFQRDIPGAQLLVLPATGHVPHEEQPAETLAAMDDFLKNLSAHPFSKNPPAR